MDDLQSCLTQFSFHFFNSLGIVLRDAESVSIDLSEPTTTTTRSKTDELTNQLMEEHDKIHSILSQLQSTNTNSIGFEDQIDRLKMDELEINKELEIKIERFIEWNNRIMGGKESKKES